MWTAGIAHQSIDPGEGIALTFDDGPDLRGTPAVVRALRKVGATATFFVIAPRAAEHPELVAEIQEEGHTVGLHCDRHVRHRDRGRDWVHDDTEQALARLWPLGVRPQLWRAPWGVNAPFTEELADEFGLELVGWDVDTQDWRGDSADTMFAATRARLHGGCTVLAHDGIGPGAERADCAATADYVALVAEHAAAAGAALVSL